MTPNNLSVSTPANASGEMGSAEAGFCKMMSIALSTIPSTCSVQIRVPHLLTRAASPSVRSCANVLESNSDSDGKLAALSHLHYTLPTALQQITRMGAPRTAHNRQAARFVQRVSYWRTRTCACCARARCLLCACSVRAMCVLCACYVRGMCMLCACYARPMCVLCACHACVCMFECVTAAVHGCVCACVLVCASFGICVQTMELTHVHACTQQRCAYVSRMDGRAVRRTEGRTASIFNIIGRTKDELKQGKMLGIRMPTMHSVGHTNVELHVGRANVEHKQCWTNDKNVPTLSVINGGAINDADLAALIILQSCRERHHRHCSKLCDFPLGATIRHYCRMG